MPNPDLFIQPGVACSEIVMDAPPPNLENDAHPVYFESHFDVSTEVPALQDTIDLNAEA